MTRLEVESTIVNHQKRPAHQSALLYADQLCPMTEGEVSLAAISAKSKVNQTVLPHPAHALEPDVILLSREEAIRTHDGEGRVALFTDASKQGDSQVGCAVVEKKGFEWFTVQTGVLSASESVFRGEIYAIRMAIDYIESNANELEGKEISIYSDSMSGLMALRKSDCLDAELYNIRKNIQLLQMEKRIKVLLHWVPGHENVTGNEMADMAAKEAVYEESDNDYIEWSKSLIKREMQKGSKAIWQSEWGKATSGRLTHKLFPRIGTALAFSAHPKLNEYDKILLRRAASGHFPCNSYLLRFKRRTDQPCRFCQFREETLEHLILNCPRFGQIKFEMAAGNSLNLHDLDLKDYFNISWLIELTCTILKLTVKAA
jgi:ribonuclease HI